MKIELYSKENCKYCEMSARALEQSGLEFTTKKLDVDFDREFVVNNFPTARTFPIVVINGELLGGFQELSLMLERIK